MKNPISKILQRLGILKPDRLERAPTSQPINDSPVLRNLYDLLGYPDWPATADNIFGVLRNWTNDELYQKLPGESYEKDTWPCSPELMLAFRAALVELQGTVEGYNIAHCLVRCGCREVDTLSGLAPMDVLLFKWKNADFTAAQLYEKFNFIDAAGKRDSTELAKLDAWIADPSAGISNNSNPSWPLFIDRQAICYLHDNGGWPKYGKLITEFAAVCVPPIPISNVTQEDLGGDYKDITKQVHAEMGNDFPKELKGLPILQAEQSLWKISFMLSDQLETIFVPGDDTWLNDSGLASEFNKLLAKLGRKDRVMKFMYDKDGPSSCGQYIIAEPVSFHALCNEMGVVLVSADFPSAAKV